MKKWLKSVVLIVLSLCLLLCFPVSVSAEEDLLSHYNGNDMDYYEYVFNYIYPILLEEYPYAWDIMLDGAISAEMVKMYNAFHNDISHPYLCGKISEETGEITITGLKPTGYVTPYTSGYGAAYHTWEFADRMDEIVIPDEIDGYPVTKIAGWAFSNDADDFTRISSVIFGDNVREIGDHAFFWQSLKQVTFGEKVEIIHESAFEECHDLKVIHSWGNNLREIQANAFYGLTNPSMPSLPSTVEYIGMWALVGCPKDFVIPKSVKKIHADAIGARSLIFLSKDMEIEETELYPLIVPYKPIAEQYYIYCYAGSAPEENAIMHGYMYYLIDGDSLLWDGETVEGNALTNCIGMTEAELRSHLGIDGTSSEIRIDGLEDGKVVNGTTVTLFHTFAQAPGKVYTVRTPGDADGDGARTLLDVAQLVRFIAGGWDVTIDLLNADVNVDGFVNLKDAALLRRFLAGWDVTLQ